MRYGFVGLGNMGGPMACRLAEQGQSVTAFDLSSSACEVVAASGAAVASSVHEMAGQVDAVFVCLPSIAASTAVAEEIAAVTADSGAIQYYVEMSTIGKRAAEEIAAVLAPVGISLIDAPVSGGGSAVRAGALTIMASGPRATFDAVRPGLEAIGKRVIFVAEQQGLAQVMKLLNNMCAIGQMAIAMEASAFGVKAGLDPDVLLEVLNSSSGRSGATRYILPQVLHGKYETGATMQIAYKDVALCVAEAEREGVPMWLGAAVAQMWRHGVLHSGPDADMGHLVDLINSWSRDEPN
jgi:3-hydroxyisobutyrate dehydrogenase-like beta-hydroxyacid dehydrogenase